MRHWWQSEGRPTPIVEFHDVQTEPGGRDDYLRLLDGPLAAPFAASGGVAMGSFRVALRPDRAIVVRGFADRPGRRRALEHFYGGPEWARRRSALHDHQRNAKTILARAVWPAEGVLPLRPGAGFVACIAELRSAEQLGPYHTELMRDLRAARLGPVAAFATLESVNDVPAVPVVRNRTHHIALMPVGGRLPDMRPEQRARLRFAPETLQLDAAPALVW